MNEELKSAAPATNEALSTTGIAQGPFISRLVHELRNLLAPMGNVAQLLRLRASEDERLAPATAMLERQIDSVGRLLEKLTAADHLLRPGVRLPLARLDLRELVAAGVAACREGIERRHRQLQLALPARPVYVNGSAPHLASVVRELIDNATRYTREGGKLWIELDSDDHEVRLRVRDDGRGIAAERLTSIFAPRCGAAIVAQEDRGGLGLSLATAARVLALHGGRIDATSAGLGAGSEFTLRLPGHNAARADDATAAPGTTAAPDQPPRRVLIVDDNDAMQDSLRTMLEELGQQVRSALDGEEAVRIAKDWQPTLVLLDINLPKMNGFRVAQALRAQFPPSRMAIVMMTGDGLVDAVLRGAQAVGVDRCIDKMQAAVLMRELLAAAPRPG